MTLTIYGEWDQSCMHHNTYILYIYHYPIANSHVIRNTVSVFTHTHTDAPMITLTIIILYPDNSHTGRAEFHSSRCVVKAQRGN